MCYDTEKTQAPQHPGDGISGAVDQAVHSRSFEIGYKQGSADSRDTLAELFSYHPPTEVTLPKFAAINQAAKNFAEVVLQNCAPGSDRSWAIGLIRSARMAANASVASNGLSI